MCGFLRRRNTRARPPTACCVNQQLWCMGGLMEHIPGGESPTHPRKSCEHLQQQLESNTARSTQHKAAKKKPPTKFLKPYPKKQPQSPVSASTLATTLLLRASISLPRNAPAAKATPPRLPAHLAQQRLYERRVEELSRSAVCGGPRARSRRRDCASVCGGGRGCGG